MIGGIKCYFGYHDNEMVPVLVTSHLYARPELIPEDLVTAINNVLWKVPRHTHYWKCKRCGKQKEVWK